LNTTMPRPSWSCQNGPTVRSGTAFNQGLGSGAWHEASAAPSGSSPPKRSTKTTASSDRRPRALSRAGFWFFWFCELCGSVPPTRLRWERVIPEAAATAGRMALGRSAAPFPRQHDSVCNAQPRGKRAPRRGAHGGASSADGGLAAFSSHWDPTDTGCAEGARERAQRPKGALQSERGRRAAGARFALLSSSAAGSAKSRRGAASLRGRGDRRGYCSGFG
jgi:hypothetical protein